MANNAMPQNDYEAPTFDFSEISAEVMEFLQARGFIVVPVPEHRSIEIGEPRPVMPGFLGKLLPPTKALIGHLFFWRESHNMKGSLTWNLWVYNEEGKKKLAPIVEELRKRYGSDIKILVR